MIYYSVIYHILVGNISYITSRYLCFWALKGGVLKHKTPPDERGLRAFCMADWQADYSQPRTIVQPGWAFCVADWREDYFTTTFRPFRM